MTPSTPFKISDTAAVRSRSWRRKGTGRRADSVFALLAAMSGVLILLILGYMVISTTGTALPVFSSEGISFATSTQWDPSSEQYGTLWLIVGTLVTSAIALLIAVPLSIGVALFLTEYSPRWLKGPIGYAVDLLAAVPSVVYALWGMFVLVPWVFTPVNEFLAEHLGFIPIFSGPSAGYSFFTAGAVLAIMITPIITSLSREVFATVPVADKHAAYALGATRWEMIRQAVLPRGRAGVVGATMLGLGRALGETIVVAVLAGSSLKVVSSVVKPGYSMAGVIANQFQEATSDHIRALIGVGVLLFVMTIIINMIARALVWRFNRA